MKILIVEDDLEAADAMARGLGDAGHECVKAADGEEGLSAARDGEFDAKAMARRCCSCRRWARWATG
jgi:two-component system OmpR family response regulator